MGANEQGIDDVPGMCEIIMDLLSSHLTEMALEEKSKELLFQDIAAQFGLDAYQKQKLSRNGEIINTFPSRVMWEFARDIAKSYWALHQDKLCEMQADGS